MSRAAARMIACGIALLGAFVIFIANSGGGCGGMLASGRVVYAHSDTIWVSSSNEADTSHLSLGALEIDVEPTQVVIEGEPVATLDAAAKSVMVTRADGRLTVVADGTTVYDAPIAK